MTLILGAGIGGATPALALARRGLEYDLVERRAELTQQGAGVILGPNVMAALGPLGLDEAVAAAAVPIPRVDVVSADGAVLSTVTYQIAGWRWPAMAIHRADLHRILLGALPRAPRLGVHAQAVRQGPTGSEVDLSDGSTARPSLVVGSEGIRSPLRDQLNPGFQTRYAGYTCWRFVVPGEYGPAREIWGRGRRMGVIPIGGDRTYVFLTLNAPPRAAPPFGDKQGLIRLFDGFPPDALAVFDALDGLSGVLHNDLEDGVASQWWSPGCALLGDAAHAVTPNLGQGAGLAIEDAVCLGALVGEADALPRYEAYRRPRAVWIQQTSRRLGWVAQLQSPPLVWLRDTLTRLTPQRVSQAQAHRLLTVMPGVPQA